MAKRKTATPVAPAPPKRGRGQPPFQPTQALREQVEAYSAVGIPEVDIALVMNIHPMTLRKYFSRELRTGHVKALAKVGGTLYNLAVTHNNVTAGIFFMKARGHWRDHTVVEHTGKNGGPLGFSALVVASMEEANAKGKKKNDDDES